MTRPKVSLVAASGVPILLAMCMVAAIAPAGYAQGDPLIGTWKFNLAKSKYNPGPPPKSQTLTYEAAGQGLKGAVQGTSAEGAPIKIEFTNAGTYDNKDYPVKGSQDFDASAYKRVDTYTVEFTRKTAGKIVQTGTRVLSKDGKTLTVTTKGVNAKGQSINTVAVYEKQ